jgi:hypothetical protein
VREGERVTGYSPGYYKNRYIYSKNRDGRCAGGLTPFYDINECLCLLKPVVYIHAAYEYYKKYDFNG